jgi:hypothetical protein
MLIRRVVPAVAATLAAYTGLAFAAGGVLRQHYLAPLVTSNLNVPGSAWIFSQWFTRDGRVVPTASVLNQLSCPSLTPGKPKVITLYQCAAQQGYTVQTRYQPASRFWPFQWIEASWLLALSVVLIAATVWLAHRRAA